jgi:hypothetical protein
LGQFDRFKTSRSAPNLPPGRLIWPSIWGISVKMLKRVGGRAGDDHEPSGDKTCPVANGSLLDCQDSHSRRRQIRPAEVFDPLPVILDDGCVAVGPLL